MINLGDVRVFLEAAASASFSEAARRLKMPKSSVNRQIERLETTVGGALFDRTSRRIVLTQGGRDFLPVARRLYDDGIEAETILRAGAGQTAGRLTVSTTGPFARAVLMPHLPAFLERHPGVQLALWLTPARTDVGSGDAQVDVAIRMRSSASADLASRKLGEIDFQIVASPGYVATLGAPATPAALRDHRMIELGPPNKAHQVDLRRGQDVATVRYTPCLHIDDPEAVCLAAQGGIGLAVVPSFLAAPAIAEGRLVRVLADWAPASIPVTVLYRTDIAPPRRVSAFVEFLFEVGGAVLR